jgi:hypothetical protein
MNEEEFTKRFGQPPEDDDLDLVNCKKVGVVGHWFCGICEVHGKPRVYCGCQARALDD